MGPGLKIKMAPAPCTNRVRAVEGAHLDPLKVHSAPQQLAHNFATRPSRLARRSTRSAASD